MYISTNLVSTPSINLNQARLEIERMALIVSEMYEKVIDILTNPDKKLGKEIEEILTLENKVDLLEKEISDFLVKVSRDVLTKEQSNELTSMLHKINELESIGDQCESIMKLLRRKYDHKITFSEQAKKEIIEISQKTRDFLKLISTYIALTSKNIMPQAEVLETRIDELKKELRKSHIRRLNEQTCEVDSGIIFIDMVSCFEKIGDHCYNIAETISGLRLF
jgi:phosphate:Na+ symporter